MANPPFISHGLAMPEDGTALKALSGMLHVRCCIDRGDGLETKCLEMWNWIDPACYLSSVVVWMDGRCMHCHGACSDGSNGFFHTSASIPFPSPVRFFLLLDGSLMNIPGCHPSNQAINQRPHLVLERIRPYHPFLPAFPLPSAPFVPYPAEDVEHPSLSNPPSQVGEWVWDRG